MTIHVPKTLPEGGKAQRVFLSLSNDISTGVYSEGSLLPGENKLAERFGVSRITIRRALDALAADGQIQKKTGAGSIVLARPERPQSITADFATLMPQLVEMSTTTTARLLSFSYAAASKTVSSALGIANGDFVQTAVRIRLSSNQPFSHLTTHVPEAIARNYDEADLATQPLFRLFERSGVSVSSAYQSVTATLAAPDVADALSVSVGAPLLSLTRVVRDSEGRGIEYLSALYRPDLFRLEMTLSRVGSEDARHWEPVIGATEE